MPDETLSEQIETAAALPASTAIDGTSINNRPLTEMIEADRHVNGKEALARPRMGMIVRKMARGSALGE